MTANFWGCSDSWQLYKNYKQVKHVCSEKFTFCYMCVIARICKDANLKWYRDCSSSVYIRLPLQNNFPISNILWSLQLVSISTVYSNVIVQPPFWSSDVLVSKSLPVQMHTHFVSPLFDLCPSQAGPCANPSVLCSACTHDWRKVIITNLS